MSSLEKGVLEDVDLSIAVDKMGKHFDILRRKDRRSFSLASYFLTGFVICKQKAILR
jgi:hypothetical protein